MILPVEGSIRLQMCPINERIYSSLAVKGLTKVDEFFNISFFWPYCTPNQL